MKSALKNQRIPFQTWKAEQFSTSFIEETNSREDTLNLHWKRLTLCQQCVKTATRVLTAVIRNNQEE